MEIWINPACSKCRTAVSTLDAAGVEYTVRRYLDEVPTVAELRAVLDRMGLEPWDVARPAEVRQAGITLAKDPAHREEWVAAMVAAPRTIQRPILTASDGTTLIGRDPDSLQRAIEADRG